MADMAGMDSNLEMESANSTQCVPPISVAITFVLYGVNFCISIAVFVTLAFIKRRARLAPNACNGRPGLPIPMDFLIAPRHRWIYVAIFSVMAISAFQSFRKLNSSNYSDDLYLNLFLKLFIWPLSAIIIIILQYFPLFGCVDAALPLVGHVMGFIYSVMWYAMVLASISSVYIQEALQCNEDGDRIINSTMLCVFIFRDAPHVLVCGSIVAWYIYQVVFGFVGYCRRVNRRRRGFMNFTTTNTYAAENVHRFPTLCCDYQIERVKALLKRSIDEATQSRIKSILVTAWRYTVPFDKHFRLPLPFLGAVAAIVMLLYQLCFVLGFSGILLATETRRLFNSINIKFSGNKLAKDILDIALNGMPALLVLAPILSLIVCVLMLVHMIGCISKMMKAVARGGFKEKLPGVLSRVPAAWKYIGLQIGFFVCAWLIYYAIFILLGAFLAGLYICLRIPQTRIWTINTILGLLIPIIWAKAIFYSQYLICKFLFFADKEGKFISITNRNLFSWFSFVLFFYNGLAGFVGAIFRIAMSAVFSLILLFRLDEVALMKKFDSFDFGHKAFLGFFYLDYAYNNAVVHVFIKNLKESLDNNIMTPSSSGNLNMEGGPDRIATNRFPPIRVYDQRRIRNRWLVAYTLIRNPSLQNLTASNLRTHQQLKSRDLIETSSEASVQVHRRHVL